MGPRQRQLLLLGCTILAIVGAFLGYRLIRTQLGHARVEHDPLNGPPDGLAPGARTPSPAPPTSTATIRARLLFPVGIPDAPKVAAWWLRDRAGVELAGDILTIQASPGRGRASFHVTGCVVVTRDVDLAPGAVADWGTLTLAAAGRLVGTVVDPDGRPVAAFIYPKVGEALVPLTSTDDTGAFTFDGLPYGDAELRVEGKGFVQRTIRYPFVAGGAPALIRVLRGGGVRGIVLDVDARPAPRAGYVTFVDPDDPENRDRMAFPHIEDDGRFEVRLHPGRYRVRTTLDAREATAEVHVVYAVTRELTLQLRGP